MNPIALQPRSQKGAALIMAVGLILILGIVMGGLVSLGRFDIVSRQALVVTDSVFYLAETGIETGINYLRNIDDPGSPNWFDNADGTGTSLPNLQFTLGPDQLVDLSVYYPATELRADIVAGMGFIPVVSVEPFIREGTITGAEVFYVFIDTDRIRISGYSEAAETLQVWPTDPVDGDHYLGKSVYPITQMNQDINASTTTIPVANTRGFLTDGTLYLYNQNTNAYEFIRYIDKTDTAFLNCTRGSNNSTAEDPTAGEVIAGDWQVLPVQYEATLVSRGTTGGMSKTLEVTVQYKNF